MIVNNKYSFLFVHIQKTAGTSITECLHKIDGTKIIGNSHSFISHNSVEKLDDYFKFCFVRNPWDRLVSWYNMMVTKRTHNDFSSYLLNNSNNFSEFLELTDVIYETCYLEWDKMIPYPKSISFNQLDYISDNDGNILVDFIGRFENINEDYNKIMKEIGSNYPLPHLNKFDHKDYRNYYTDKDIEKVYNLYKRDIDYFGYRFQ